MKLSQRIENDICIIHVENDITWQNSDSFRFYVQTLREDNHLKAILVNLEKVIKIDSAGIGVLYSLLKDSHKADIQWMLCQLNDDVLRVIKSVGLDKTFICYDTEQEALVQLQENL